MALFRLRTYKRRRPAAVALWCCLCVVVLAATSLAPLPAASRAAAAPAPSRVLFPDAAGHWAEAAIAALAARSVVAGFADGRFDPEGRLTRAQLAKLVVAGLEGGGVADLLAAYPAPYTDTAAHWARGWVTAATELDLFRGYGDGRFGPDDPVTRAQAAAVFVRALGWEAESAELAVTMGAGVLDQYYDAADVPEWAVGYVAVAVQRGLLRGYGDLTLRPSAFMSRAEAAVLILRTLDRLGLAFDVGGELLNVDDAGWVTLGNLWGWPADGHRLTLQTAAATACFRNGVRVQLADLVTHDTVLAIMGSPADGHGKIAPILFLHALSWDVLGDLEAIGAEGLVVASGSAAVDVRLGRGTAVWRHGRPAEAAALVPGDRIYALLDPISGTARIVDAVRPQVVGVIAEVGRQEGRDFLDINVRGETPATGPDVQPQRVFLAAGAFVCIDGLPARAFQLSTGMNVLLAEYDPDKREAGYCEAGLPAWLAERNLPRAGPAAGVAVTAAAAAAVEVAAAAVEVAAAADPVLWPVQSLARAPVTVTPAGSWSVASEWRTTTVRVARPAVRPARLQGQALVESRGVSVSATGAPDFWALYGSAGEGVTVAVVDTGVDPSHPVLQTTTTGERKLVDWVDFTGEGGVETIAAVAGYGGHVLTRLGPVRLGTTVSRSGVYRTGVLRESSLAQETGLGLDLNGNGRRDDSFAVVLVDTQVPGVYDLAFLDSNGNLDLGDEQGLRLFRTSGQWASFSGPPAEGGGGQGGFGYLVSSLDRQGRYVTFGFDGNGHGTHVAAVCAGHDPEPGSQPAGMAPGVRLMALKALGSDGGGGWDAILAAVTYAARNGADLVVLAVESSDLGQALSTEYRELTGLASDYGLPVFLAAGNSGPGSGTAVSVPDPELLVPVGGYVSEEMWRLLYGRSVETGGLWLHSAAGPSDNGEPSPLFVAPAAAVSAVPRPVSAVGYELFEGTSMAVPHAAGAAALLLGAARAERLQITARSLARCLAAGAFALPGHGAAEQGYGVLSVLDAAAHLPAAAVAGHVTLRHDPTGGVAFPGRQAGELLPADWPVLMTNHGLEPLRVALESGHGQVAPDRSFVFLGGGASRTVWVRPAEGRVPGLDDVNDLITARDEASGMPLGGLVVRMAARTPVVPGDAGLVMLGGHLATGTASRHYVELGEGYDWLQLSLAWFQTAGGEPAAGALRVFLYSPTGYLAAEIASPAESPGPAGPADPAAAMVINPPGGLWEIVVWGEPGQFAPNDALSYTLAVQAGGRPVLTAPERIPRPAAGQDTVQVKATVELPPGAGSVIIEVLGWLEPHRQPATVRRMAAVEPGGRVVWRLPAVTAGAATLEVTLAGLDSGDTDLSLYYLAGGVQAASWLEVGRSENVGTASERILLANPQPGEYAVVAQSRAAEGPQGLAMTATSWPLGTRTLEQVLLQADLPGPPQINLVLPSPGTDAYRAYLVLRDGRSLRPLLTVPLEVTGGLPGLLPLVGPSLTVGTYEAGRSPVSCGTPVVRVWSAPTMQGVAAALIMGGRATAGENGRVTLWQSLLGGPCAPGTPVQVTVSSVGHEPWLGYLYPAGLEEDPPVRTGGVDGRPPYPAAAGNIDEAALRQALRLKITWQGPR